MTDTIFAMATGPGRAAIAVLRLSGPEAADVVRHLAGPLPRPRTAALRPLADGPGGPPLDQAIVLFFPAPSSVTGEDCAEFHLHGGRAVVAAVLAAVGRRPGCRAAAPGEFTRRAFSHGKMDLAAVEGLADLIDAETDAQRRQALRQLDGALGQWVEAQRATLLDALAAVESAIDFSDEGDVAGDFAREVSTHAEALVVAIDRELAQGMRGEQVRDGLMVALAGPPNAGKSTLLNALARREVAIVSPVPGTTRDAIAVRLDLDGFLIHVVDTAGLRDSDDAIERLGMDRTRATLQNADLILWLSEARAPQRPEPVPGKAPVWRIATKADLGTSDGLNADHLISAENGQGLASLMDRIRTLVASTSGADGVVTRERHRAALLRARSALAVVLSARADWPMELAAEQLRAAARELDGLVGRLDTEDVLGAIFSRFCVGK